MDRPLTNRGKVYGAVGSSPDLLGLLMRSVGPAETAVFLELQFVRGRTLVLGSGIVSPLALGTSQGNDFSHEALSLLINGKGVQPWGDELPLFFGSSPGLGLRAPIPGCRR